MSENLWLPEELLATLTPEEMWLRQAYAEDQNSDDPRIIQYAQYEALAAAKPMMKCKFKPYVWPPEVDAHDEDPLVCHLCGYVHKQLKENPMDLWKEYFVQAGIMRPRHDVRPYYATYLSSLAPHALWNSGFSYNQGTNGPYNGYYTSWCTGRAGEYTSSPGGSSNYQNGNTDWWVRLIMAGGQTNQSGFPGGMVAGHHNMGEISLYSGVGPTWYGAGNGYWCQQGTATNPSNGAVCFVPTPANP